MMRNLKEIFKSFEKWRMRRHFNRGRQIHHLLTLLYADHRWLGSDKTADALTSRYLDALSSNWYEKSFEDVAQLRSRLGLVPPGGYDPGFIEVNPGRDV